MSLTPTRKYALISIDKALIDEITTESGFKLYLSPEYNFENNVTISGIVESLPKNHGKNLRIGDDVAFSYHVISERSFPNTSDFFVLISEGDPSLRIWQNSKGEKLRMRAHQGVISIFYTGVFFDKYGRFDPEKSTQGTESQVERWLHSNFQFGNCENFVYKNLIHIDGKDYWKCPIEDIFARKNGEGIEATSDRIICDYIDIPVDKRITEVKGIKLPEGSVMMRLYDRGIVVSGGNEIGVKQGDIISFEERYVEKYELFGKSYFLIRERRVDGLWEEAA